MEINSQHLWHKKKATEPMFGAKLAKIIGSTKGFLRKDSDKNGIGFIGLE